MTKERGIGKEGEKDWRKRRKENDEEEGRRGRGGEQSKRWGRRQGKGAKVN